MKILFFILFTLSSLTANPIMIDNISQTLDKIAYEASQKNQENLTIHYDPFYHDKKKTDLSKKIKSRLKETKQVDKKPLQLSMILNKKAFINGQWYKEKEKVARYLLEKVNQDSVILKKKNKIIILKLKMPNHLLLTKEVH